jgi:hypothetical protein
VIFTTTLVELAAAENPGASQPTDRRRLIQAMVTYGDGGIEQVA